ncbi:MAG: M20/M25/M40 family metallo-hydrolase [Candidatus Dormibacteria bacterium]
MTATIRDQGATVLLTWLRQRSQTWEDALEELVRLESPSGDAEHLAACARWVAGRAREWVAPDELDLLSEAGVPQLRARVHGTGAARVLLLCHLDTVWSLGSYQPPFNVEAGVARGPGVFDMKGGVVVALAALAALRALGGDRPSVTLLCTGDEEVGSAASRALIEAEARGSAAVLVLEPPAGAAVKVARKGVGTYSMHLLGRAAHAGLEPERGVNSVVELAALVGQVADFARPEIGTTVTPTVFSGGTRTNVVPAAAELRIDVRFSTKAEADRVDLGIRALKPSHPEAVLRVEGGPNRPPLEETASAELFSLASLVADRIGLGPLQSASVGGGSDGNFTAALGIPTLDGLGIVGGNAHAAGEWADLTSIPDRAALIAGCLQSLASGVPHET